MKRRSTVDDLDPSLGSHLATLLRRLPLTDAGSGSHRTRLRLWLPAALAWGTAWAPLGVGVGGATSTNLQDVPERDGEAAHDILEETFGFDVLIDGPDIILEQKTQLSTETSCTTASRSGLGACQEKIRDLRHQS